MSRFEHRGNPVYYEQDGDGDPVLILPGWAGSIDELSPIRRALASRYRVIAADLPGSGRSQPQPRTYTPSYFQDDAEVFLEFLDDQGAGPAHLIGFSDGGEVALIMAAVRPDAVRSVLTWGAAGQLVAPPGMLEAFSCLIDDPIPPLREFADYLRTTYGVDNARIMTRTESEALRGIVAAGGDLSFSRAADIACPVLLLTGEHDPFCPPPLVAALAEVIPGAEFIKVDGSAHDLHTARPDWLADTAANWLGRLPHPHPSTPTPIGR